MRTNLRVLIVDDNEDAADTLAMLLSALGMIVEVAYDGCSGLLAADTFRPDVMLVDLHMPKMGGLDLARHLRAATWGAGVTLVAITAWGHERVGAQVSDAGFDEHLLKPVRTEDVCRILEHHASSHASAEPQRGTG